MYDFNLMFVTLSTYLTMHVYLTMRVFFQEKPHSYVLIYWAQKKEDLLILWLRSMKQIYKFNKSLFIWIDQ